MKIIKGKIENKNAERTLMFDEKSEKYFMVSTISGEPSETLIFKSDKDGNILNDYIEVWETIFANHEEVIELLVTDVLTTEYFYNMD